MATRVRHAYITVSHLASERIFSALFNSRKLSPAEATPNSRLSLLFLYTSILSTLLPCGTWLTNTHPLDIKMPGIRLIVVYFPMYPRPRSAIILFIILLLYFSYLPFGLMLKAVKDEYLDLLQHRHFYDYLPMPPLSLNFKRLLTLSLPKKASFFSVFISYT